MELESALRRWNTIFGSIYCFRLRQFSVLVRVFVRREKAVMETRRLRSRFSGVCVDDWWLFIDSVLDLIEQHSSWIKFGRNFRVSSTCGQPLDFFSPKSEIQLQSLSAPVSRVGPCCMSNESSTRWLAIMKRAECFYLPHRTTPNCRLGRAIMMMKECVHVMGKIVCGKMRVGLIDFFCFWLLSSLFNCRIQVPGMQQVHSARRYRMPYSDVPNKTTIVIQR